MLHFLIFITAIFLSSVNFAKTCQPETLINQACDHFRKRHHEPWIKMKNGTQYRNPLYDGKPMADETGQPDLKNEKRIRNLFEDIKLKLRDHVLNGVPESKLTAEKKNLLRRIDTISLVAVEDQSREIRIKCLQKSDNAFYVPETHSISICSGYYKYPEISLVVSLGHEIGHGIDPCHTQHELYSVSRDFISSQLQQDSELPSHWDQYFGDKDSIHLLADDRYKSLFSNLQDKKSVAGYQLLASSIPKSKYPYAELNSCLIKEEKFEERRPPGIESHLCEYSQMNEAMSDVMGAYALSAYLKAAQVDSKEEAYALFSMADAELCDTQMKARPLLKGIPDYPNTRKRFQSIVLKVPGVSEAFGCSVQEKSCFTLGAKSSGSTFKMKSQSVK